jgi:hypothetical protein
MVSASRSRHNHHARRPTYLDAAQRFRHAAELVLRMTEVTNEVEPIGPVSARHGSPFRRSTHARWRPDGCAGAGALGAYPAREKALTKRSHGRD